MNYYWIIERDKQGEIKRRYPSVGKVGELWWTISVIKAPWEAAYHEIMMTDGYSLIKFDSDTSFIMDNRLKEELDL